MSDRPRREYDRDDYAQTWERIEACKARLAELDRLYRATMERTKNWRKEVEDEARLGVTPR